jgi:hypothetical protein
MIAVCSTGETTMTALSRRTITKATGAISATLMPACLPGQSATAHESSLTGTAELVPRPRPPGADASHTAPSTTYIFFNTEEAAFIEAAVARLIPADEEWGGALEACVPN